ncbi:hypothetical protein EBZ39_08790 [bacterium]|nr:hypothetical protein [bacterium]
MAAVTMLDRLVEAGLKELLSTSVTGVTYHLSQETIEKNPPFLAIRATLGAETPVPRSGVFELPVEIVLAARADDTSPQDFNVKSAQLLQAFYHDSAATTRLNATTAIGSARAFRLDVTGTESGVEGDERLFTRTLRLTVLAYPNSNAA